MSFLDETFLLFRSELFLGWSLGLTSESSSDTIYLSISLGEDSPLILELPWDRFRCMMEEHRVLLRLPTLSDDCSEPVGRGGIQILIVLLTEDEEEVDKETFIVVWLDIVAAKSKCCFVVTSFLR